MTGAPTEELVSAYVLLHPEDAALALESSPAPEVASMVAGLGDEEAGALLRTMTPDLASRVLARLPDDAFVRAVARLDAVRAATLLSRLDEPSRRLALLDERTVSELSAIMQWPARSAGLAMDPAATTFRPETTASQAIERLRASHAEQFEDLFLVDGEGVLVGAVALERLAIAQPGARLSDLASDAVMAVAATATIDEVLEVFASARPGGVAVVDYLGRLLGVIRQNDLVDAAEREASADLQTMVGVSREERALSPPGFAVRKRLPWLNVNLLTAFLAAAVVGAFESTIARISALAVLLPVVAGQSGNSGAQALAVTMRGLALREVRPASHWRRLLFKEGAVGFLNGVGIGVLAAAGVLAWSRSVALAAVTGVSMVLAMTVAGLAGASVPLVLKRLGQDPAQSSSIVLTTVTDVFGFMTFLGLATVFASALGG